MCCAAGSGHQGARIGAGARQPGDAWQTAAWFSGRRDDRGCSTGQSRDAHTDQPLSARRERDRPTSTRDPHAQESQTVIPWHVTPGSRRKQIHHVQSPAPKSESRSRGWHYQAPRSAPSCRQRAAHHECDEEDGAPRRARSDGGCIAGPTTSRMAQMTPPRGSRAEPPNPGPGAAPQSR